MDLLLKGILSTYNLKGLRRLFHAVVDHLESQLVRMGVLLSLILISRLPPELCLIVSRTLSEGKWNFESMMEIFRRKIDVRERPVGATSPKTKTPSSTDPPPTTLSLTTGALL